MDTKLIEDITRAVINETIYLNWRFYILYAFISFLVLCISAIVFPYLTARSKNLATKSDFDLLIEQLKENTEVTESIRTAISHSDWELKEYKLLRRTKLEELLLAIHEVDRWLENYRNAMLYGGEYNENSPMFKVEVLSCLYFSGLIDELKKYKEIYAAITICLLKASSNILNLKEEDNSIKLALSVPQQQNVLEGLVERQKKQNDKKIEIITKATDEYLKLFSDFVNVKLEIENKATEIMTKITNAKVIDFE